MRKCMVYILGFANRLSHVSMVHEILTLFQKSVMREDEVYSPKFYLLEETEASVRAALEYKGAPRADYIVSIGTDMSMILKKLYTEIDPIPTMFVCPENPIGNGLINSFEKPGGWFSGVYGEIKNTDSYEGTQDIFRWLLPYVTKVLIPYDTQAGGLNILVVEAVAAELKRIGFEPIIEQVSGDDEVVECVYKHIASVHAVASFAVSLAVERNIGYMCGMTEPKRLLISNNGDFGVIKSCAALAVRRTDNLYACKQVVAMVRTGWYERVWPGLQPITIVADKDLGEIELVVNQFMLPHLPEYITEAMHNTPEVVVVSFWPYHPFNNQIKEDEESKMGKNKGKERK
ncbi:MAG: ABC transporter substrate binding protein [bacterium]